MKLAPRLGATALVLVTALSGAAVVAPPGADATAGYAATTPTRDTTATTARAARRTDRFKIASFNVLGASHTGRRSGLRRTRGLVHLLGSRGVTIAGLQEFERTQYLRFLRLTHRRWGVVAVPRGKGIDTRNAIVYSKQRFRLLWKSSLSIPYYGPEVRVPIARLRSRATGKVFYVMNTHNAAGKNRTVKRKRRVAVRRQVRQLAHLRRRGATTFFLGDMNDRRKVHCAVTRTGRFKSASGGSVGRRCTPPRRNSIDWIFGTRDVAFARWVSDRTPLTAHVSDHPLVVVRVRMRR
jgi:endonuclease/exonuclease/phosphatase family metal-dependent hydrolase